MALRKPPAALDPALEITGSCKEWETYDCELVTPLYGGGVTAGEVDEEMPVRASAIRGQLRFWWRLLARHRSKLTGEELRHQEFELWGGLGKPVQASKVWLRVSSHSGLVRAPWAIYNQKRDGSWMSLPDPEDWANAPYALFPAQGKKPGLRDSKPPGKLTKPGLKWHIDIAFSPECSGTQKVEIVDALRWWASFGGVGARTRRGLGAVRIAGIEPVSADEASLAGCRLVIAPSARQTAVLAWQDSVEKLRNFRQGVEMGRNPGKTRDRPGRSRWPEPASIRAATGTHRIKQDGTSFAPAAGTPQMYPRAAFGLPIVFHFQNERTDQKPDPVDVILEPVDVGGQRVERMASPLILRPCLGKGGRWHAAALLLPDKLADDAVLALRRGSNVIAHGHVSRQGDLDENGLPPRNPMIGRGANALDAFLVYFAG